ncbi:MAG: hypothetical protein ATN36_07530 [Epulopiscium sp. Nele67-Bin005]|nr:MAG: hypothetical protein ATN36_07530 [Epulopiscium sp. Nele67-Bin005]
MLASEIKNLMKYFPNNNLICEKAGTIISGVKSLEILNVDSSTYAILSGLNLPIEIRFVRPVGSNVQIIMYNPQTLNELLLSDNRINYLRELSYPEHYYLESYINTLIENINSSKTFPHEIGFFIGYTMKDVLAYMGIEDSPYVKTLGWNMYGDTTESEKLYYKILDVKNQIKFILNCTTMSA